MKKGSEVGFAREELHAWPDDPNNSDNERDEEPILPHMRSAQNAGWRVKTQISPLAVTTWVLLSLLPVGILSVMNNYVGAEVSLSLFCLISISLVTLRSGRLM